MSGFLSFRPEPFVWPTESEWEGEASRTGPDYIRWVQSSLNRVMGLRLAVDGIMGPATRSAVRSFQQRKGLAVDGIVGPNTEAALIAAGAPRLLDSSSAAGGAGLPSYIPARGPSGAAPPVASHAPGNLFEICEFLDDFDLDKYTLKPEHLAKISEIADQIIQSQHTDRPIRSVKIVGHTDPSGPSGYNRQLGLNRATAVKIELDGLLRGVKPTIHSRVQSRGEAPIRGVSDPAKLRRVDVCFFETGGTLRDALVILKRAETLRRANAGYHPAGTERLRIDSAIAKVKAEPKYQVNETTYLVTFAKKASTKIRVTTIEDFVLFVEAVEAQYPGASAQQVVSEIRQIWYSDENWEVLVASEGIIERGTHVDIETEPNPIAIRFDMDDLAASVASDATGRCELAGGKVLRTPMGQVNIGHVMVGIDARLSGFPASYPQKHLKARGHDTYKAMAKYSIFRDYSRGDPTYPTAFVTFAGDLGQAYAAFIFTRYQEGDRSATLKNFVAQCAKPSELLGDIHGYIAAAVAADVRSSGTSPTGKVVTASGIVRDMYLVDKSSSGTTYEGYLEKVAGEKGEDLRNYIYWTSISFAHLWYAKLNFDEHGALWKPGQAFGDYVREFSELADRHENSAAPGDTLDGIVGEFLTMAKDLLK